MVTFPTPLKYMAMLQQIPLAQVISMNVTAETVQEKFLTQLSQTMEPEK